nr:MAG TPA: hypothetical protein [Caudoviricetes sp.]
MNLGTIRRARSSGSQLHRTTALPFSIKIFGLWFWSILFDFKIDKSNFFIYNQGAVKNN